MGNLIKKGKYMARIKDHIKSVCRLENKKIKATITTIDSKKKKKKNQEIKITKCGGEGWNEALLEFVWTWMIISLKQVDTSRLSIWTSMVTITKPTTDSQKKKKGTKIYYKRKSSNCKKKNKKKKGRKENWKSTGKQGKWWQ